MLKLWGRATSANVMKVLWLLDALRLPYQHEEVGGPFGGTDTPSYRAMNPTCTVPTLQDGDFSLWESNAILRYLCDAHAPNTPFWPSAPAERARIDQWLDYQQAVLNAPQTVVFQGLIRTPPEKRDVAAIDRAVGLLTSRWSLLDNALAGRAFLAAGHLTLAEMAFGPNLHRWLNFPIARPEMPNLRAWYERMLEHKAFVKHCGGPVV